MVKNLTGMLDGATNFDFNINTWQIDETDTLTNMITNTTLATDQLFGFTNDEVPDIKQFNKPICFNKGTKILCYKNNEEVYIPVEQLKQGDLVKTYLHGYKPIYMIKKGVFTLGKKGTMGMYKMKKSGSMIDDLEMTGLHAQLIDKNDEKYKKDQEKQESKVMYYNKQSNKYNSKKVYIDDKYRLLAEHSSDFEKMRPDKYEIYTFSLDKQLQYGIWANGVLVETTSQRAVNKN
jgi:hypothetical protein